MSSILTKKAHTRLKKIHILSKRLNGPSHEKHLKKLLSLVQKHTKEIILLKKSHNDHYLVEIGDLLILCLEVLLENKKDVDQMIALCFDRYENKLTQLLKVIE